MFFSLIFGCGKNNILVEKISVAAEIFPETMNFLWKGIPIFPENEILWKFGDFRLIVNFRENLKMLFRENPSRNVVFTKTRVVKIMK